MKAGSIILLIGLAVALSANGLLGDFLVVIGGVWFAVALLGAVLAGIGRSFANRSCPYCRESISVGAKNCPFCHGDLTPGSYDRGGRRQPFWKEESTRMLADDLRVPLVFGYVDAEGEPSDRAVTVRRVFERGGLWYVNGRDEDRQESRTFRIDRMHNAVDPGTGEIFEGRKQIVRALTGRSTGAPVASAAAVTRPAALAAPVPVLAERGSVSSVPAFRRKARAPSAGIALLAILAVAVLAVFGSSEPVAGTGKTAKDPASQIRSALDRPKKAGGPAQGMPGLRFEDVADMQILLAELGFDPGPIDGKFGPRTRAAWEAWQLERGIRSAPGSTGSLMERLRVDAAARRPTPRGGM